MLSQLFKGRKLTYPASVPQSYLGDYIGLDSNKSYVSKWEKIKMQNPGLSLGAVKVATFVKKINRTNGDVKDRALIVTATEFLVRTALLGVFWKLTVSGS
jgi:myosin-1